MSILSISVPVPASGEGAAADVSSLVGKKTVILTGTFRGLYVLLASHDDLHYVPILQFDAGGAEGARQTISGAFKSVRLRAGTPTTAPVGAVTCEISGVSVPGQNYFVEVASLPAGFSGAAAAVDLAPIMLPSGPEEDIVLICEGDFQGLLSIEGSQDGTRFAPIGDFRVDRRPEGAPAVLELPPLLAPDKVRYVRASLNGEVGADGAVVTIGGGVPASSAGGNETLAQTYALGASAVDQRPLILDAKGGKIMFDGSGALSGDEVVNFLGPAGEVFGIQRAGGIVLGPFNIVIGQVGFPSSSLSLECVSIGRGASVAAGSDSSAAIGWGASVAAGSASGVALGHGAAVGPAGSFSVAIGRSAVAGTGASPSCVSIGHGASVGPVCEGAVAIGKNAVAGTGGSPSSVALGAGSTIGSGCTSSLAAMGASVGPTAGSSYVVAIGEATVILGGCSASVAIGRGIAFLVGGISDAVAIGSGITIDNGSSYCVAVGPSNTIGAASKSNVVVGRGSSVGSTSPDCVVVGHSVAVGNACTNIVAQGHTIAVAGGATRSVVLGVDVVLSLDPVLGTSRNVVLGGDTVDVSGFRNVVIGTGPATVVGSASICILGGNVTAWNVIQIGSGAGVTPGVGADATGSICLGAGTSVVIAGTDVGIAIGPLATASDRQCVIGTSSQTMGRINELLVLGHDGAAGITTLKAVSNPAADQTGLSVTHNNGVATTSKVVKAAAAPPLGSLLLYVDP